MEKVQDVDEEEVTLRLRMCTDIIVLQTRSSLAEALASRDYVSKERDQLAEQYRYCNDTEYTL